MTRGRPSPPRRSTRVAADDFEDGPDTAELTRPRLAAGSIPASPPRLPPAPLPGDREPRVSGLRSPTRGERIVVDMKRAPVVAPGAEPPPRRRRR